jgi:hypothetical protein
VVGLAAVLELLAPSNMCDWTLTSVARTQQVPSHEADSDRLCLAIRRLAVWAQVDAKTRDAISGRRGNGFCLTPMCTRTTCSRLRYSAQACDGGWTFFSNCHRRPMRGTKKRRLRRRSGCSGVLTAAFPCHRPSRLFSFGPLQCPTPLGSFDDSLSAGSAESPFALRDLRCDGLR